MLILSHASIHSRQALEPHPSTKSEICFSERIVFLAWLLVCFAIWKIIWRATDLHFVTWRAVSGRNNLPPYNQCGTPCEPVKSSFLSGSFLVVTTRFPDATRKSGESFHRPPQRYPRSHVCRRPLYSFSNRRCVYERRHSTAPCCHALLRRPFLPSSKNGLDQGISVNYLLCFHKIQGDWSGWAGGKSVRRGLSAGKHADTAIRARLPRLGQIQ